ncbi:hypothetical protein Asp14428_29390 [Actinoplanes sp. NBRC 14428]|uniref:histidine kinase n=1 Tax=Pseudosporangium ferrugineum TaxID=439699 RepID=A0A2T0RRW9_9ACTN|nr:signal transduction histidine kinase [Pseudosporangium ferrugineum]BCJ51464.1 hypothetical protein Asp14428_29390 [Actinoplanes sp. NBRC 14428]
MAGVRPVAKRWRLIVGSSAGLLLVFTATTAILGYDVPVLAAYAAATAQCAALPLALLRPWPATALQLAGVGLFAWTQPAGDGMWPLSVPVMVVLVAYIGLIGLTRSWSVAVLVWWVTVLFCLVLVQTGPHGRTGAEASLIIFATNSVLVLFATIGWTQRGRVRRELADARRDIALEQAQRALVEERNRIARELHDVVAHSMSVIHMQATSAAYRIKDIDPESKAEFSRIAAGTRSTLREMRQLLALLRDETADSDLRPMPDLQHLGELAESARRGGVPVDLEVRGDLQQAGLADSIGLAAYRIVQESLSNVVRHAPGAPTRVRVSADDGELFVEIVNDVPARVPRPIEEPNQAGHGVVGMRERARLAGGSVEIGARPAGGYRVAARFPLPPTDEAEGDVR